MCVWKSAIKHSITLHQYETIVDRKKIKELIMQMDVK